MGSTATAGLRAVSLLCFLSGTSRTSLGIGGEESAGWSQLGGGGAVMPASTVEIHTANPHIGQVVWVIGHTAIPHMD